MFALRASIYYQWAWRDGWTDVRRLHVHSHKTHYHSDYLQWPGWLYLLGFEEASKYVDTEQAESSRSIAPERANQRQARAGFVSCLSIFKETGCSAVHVYS